MFLTEISVFLLILLISYRDFGILIDLVVYLTEYLGKIDQSLQTGITPILLKKLKLDGICKIKFSTVYS